MMPKYLRYTFLLILLTLTGYYFLTTPSLHKQHDLEEESIDQKLIPSDYFFAQRAFPYGEVDKIAFQKAIDY